jgi:hypothetical protein
MDRSHWCSAKHREWYSSACTGASHSPHYVQVQYLYSTVTAQRLTRGVPAHTHCCTLIPTITAPSPSRITPPFVVSYPTAPAFPFQGASFLWPAVRPGPVQYLQSADQAAPTPSARITSYSPPTERQRFRAVLDYCPDWERRVAIRRSIRSIRSTRGGSRDVHQLEQQ